MLLKNKMLVLLALLIYGCDIPGIIEIKNNLDEEVIISYSYQEVSEENLPQIHRIIPNEKKSIILGFGTRWNDSYLDYYPNQVVDTITIQIGDIKYFCQNQDCKNEIFSKANRQSKRKMRIEINENLIKKSFKIKNKAGR